MTLLDNLVAEIETFLIEYGMSAVAFGLAVRNDRTLVFRLRKGGGLTVASMETVRAYLDSHKKPATRSRKSAA